MSEKDLKRKAENSEVEKSGKEAKSESQAKKDATERQIELQEKVAEAKAVPEEMRIAAQKIIPFLWFDDQAEEAMTFYTSVFENSMVDSIFRYPSGIKTGPMAGMDGKVLNGSFHLAGQQFLGLDGGPHFKFTPAISFFVNCDTEQEVDRTWDRLSKGGSVMMELQEYPFSKKFGWTSDKYGLSWQICLGPQKQKINPFMMFVGANHGKAEEAMKFYTSLFPNSTIGEILRWGPGEEPEVEGTIKRGTFEICGNEYIVIDSKIDHPFNFNEALSLLIDCKDQDEIDFYWDKLSAHPDCEQCGWVKDRYGVSWQIVPTEFTRCMKNRDQKKFLRVIESILTMKKINIATFVKAMEESPEQEK